MQQKIVVALNCRIIIDTFQLRFITFFSFKNNTLFDKGKSHEYSFSGNRSIRRDTQSFCRLSTVRKPRIRKGKDIHARSSAIIDDELLIDVAP